MSFVYRTGSLSLPDERGVCVLPQHLKQYGMDDITELSGNRLADIANNFFIRLQEASKSETPAQVTVCQLTTKDRNIYEYIVTHHRLLKGSLEKVPGGYIYSFYRDFDQIQKVRVNEYGVLTYV